MLLHIYLFIYIYLFSNYDCVGSLKTHKTNTARYTIHVAQWTIGSLACDSSNQKHNDICLLYILFSVLLYYFTYCLSSENELAVRIAYLWFSKKEIKTFLKFGKTCFFDNKSWQIWQSMDISKRTSKLIQWLLKLIVTEDPSSVTISYFALDY